MRVEIDRKMTDEFPFIVPRLSADFRSGMCSLMAPNEGSNAAPYPTTSMLEEHSRYRISTHGNIRRLTPIEKLM